MFSRSGVSIKSVQKSVLRNGEWEGFMKKVGFEPRVEE